MRTVGVIVAALALVVAVALPAHAEVYKWVDGNGRTQYSNAPPPAAAVRPQVVEERLSVMGMDPAVRAWAEQRFAQRQREEEMEWQARQRAQAAQLANSQAMALHTPKIHPVRHPVIYSSYAKPLRARLKHRK